MHGPGLLEAVAGKYEAVWRPSVMSPAAGEKDPEPSSPQRSPRAVCEQLKTVVLVPYTWTDNCYPMYWSRNCCRLARSSRMPLPTLMKWWGFLMQMVASIKRLQKALPGATVLHAKLSRPINDCSDLSWTFSAFCTNWIVCLNVCSLSGTPMYLQICLKRSSVNWHRLELFYIYIILLNFHIFT